MTEFSTRLKACMKRGDMTISDLARWFDRPRATVNTWVTGREPYGPSGRTAVVSLVDLEHAISEKRGFPIPANLTWSKRVEYVQRLRSDAPRRHTRVLPVRAAG